MGPFAATVAGIVSLSTTCAAPKSGPVRSANARPLDADDVWDQRVSAGGRRANGRRTDGRGDGGAGSVKERNGRVSHSASQVDGRRTDSARESRGSNGAIDVDAFTLERNRTGLRKREVSEVGQFDPVDRY